MPLLDEVLFYSKGLQLLLRQNPQGFRWFDLTERGFKRSFWALVWCFPLMIPNWVWWHRLFIDYGPGIAQSNALFYLRMALVEFAMWMTPYMAIGVFMWLRGMRGQFDALVIISNWLNLPLYIISAVISLMELFIPAPFVIWYYVVQAQLALVVAAEFSIYFMLTRKNWPNALGMTAVAVIPSMFLSYWLNGFLGLSV